VKIAGIGGKNGDIIGAEYTTLFVKNEQVEIHVPGAGNLWLQKFGFDACITPIPAEVLVPKVKGQIPGGIGVSTFW